MCLLLPQTGSGEDGAGPPPGEQHAHPDAGAGKGNHADTFQRQETRRQKDVPGRLNFTVIVLLCRVEYYMHLFTWHDATKRFCM